MRQRRETAGTAFSFLSLDILPSLRLGRAWHLALSRVGCRGFTGPVPSASLDAERECLPASVPEYTGPVDLRRQVEEEALAANRAAASLTDEAVAAALRAAAALVRERRRELLAANAADCEAAAGKLDQGTLDRLRLDDGRVDAIASQVDATAAIEPLEREVAGWTLANGLSVSERRVPVG